MASWKTMVSTCMQQFSIMQMIVRWNIDIFILDCGLTITLSILKFLLYGCASQGLETIEFTNSIGWNRYWPRSRFSHLDRHLDWLHFAVENVMERTKTLMKRKKKEQTLSDLNWAYRHLQANWCKLVALNEFFLFIICHILNILSRSVWENLVLGRVHRPLCTVCIARPRSWFSYTQDHQNRTSCKTSYCAF